MSLKLRQKALNNIYSELEALASRIETIENEVSDAVEGMSEKASETEKGEALTAELEGLNNATSSMTDLLDALGDLKGDM